MRGGADMEEKVLIHCEKLSKAFNTPNGVFKVIEDLDIKVRENEFLVLFGPGQCGKTTILNTIAGFETPSSGNVFLKGERVVKPGPDRGMVFQTTALFPWFKVIGNVEYGLRMRGVPKKACK